MKSGAAAVRQTRDVSIMRESSDSRGTKSRMCMRAEWDRHRYTDEGREYSEEENKKSERGTKSILTRTKQVYMHTNKAGIHLYKQNRNILIRTHTLKKWSSALMIQ